MRKGPSSALPHVRRVLKCGPPCRSKGRRGRTRALLRAPLPPLSRDRHVVPQRVVPDRHALLRGLRDMAQHLQRAQRNRLQNAMQAVDYLQRRLVHPAQQLQRRTQQLEQLQQRMLRAHDFGRQQRQWRWQSLAWLPKARPLLKTPTAWRFRFRGSSMFCRRCWSRAGWPKAHLRLFGSHQSRR